MVWVVYEDLEQLLNLNSLLTDTVAQFRLVFVAQSQRYNVFCNRLH